MPVWSYRMDGDRFVLFFCLLERQFLDCVADGTSVTHDPREGLSIESKCDFALLYIILSHLCLYFSAYQIPEYV